MIDPIEIKVNFDDTELFKDIPNIQYDEKAGIIIEAVGNFWFVISPYHEEIWVKTLDDKIMFEKTGYPEEIIVLTEDKELLPYCMKDRLAFLQDRINKEYERNQ